MSKTILIISLLCCSLIAGGCISIDVFPRSGPLQESRLSGSWSDKILLIDVSGLLSSAKPDRLFDRPSLPSRIKEELTKAGEDAHIKAIVLRINSPGGTVTASDILYHEIRTFKEKKKIPVIASIMDLGTSGGYYVAVAADRIIAHPSTITGSVGVIMMTLNAEGLLEKIGVEPLTIVSGLKKSMGSPFRAMTKEERAIFQSVIGSLYERFVKVVQEGRPSMEKDAVRRLADGRIYSAEQAHHLGLVDTIGYLDDAIDLAKHKAGLKNATVITYHRAGGYKPNVYSKFSSPPASMGGFPRIDPVSLMTLLRGGTPQLMYLWMP